MSTIHDVKFADGTTGRVGSDWITRWPDDIVEVDGKPIKSTTKPGSGRAKPKPKPAPEPETTEPAPESVDENAATAAETPAPGRKKGA